MDQSDNNENIIPSIDESIFWQAYFDRIAHLNEAFYYKYSLQNVKTKKNWVFRERKPVEILGKEEIPKLQKFVKKKSHKESNFGVIYYVSPVASFQKLSLSFKTRENKIGTVEWIFNTKLDNNWFPNVLGLLKATFKLYHQYPDTTKNNLFHKINKSYASFTDQRSSKKIWDPELFVSNLTRRMFLLLRLRIYALLKQVGGRTKVDITYPFSLFILKAHHVKSAELPSFSYYFDLEQLSNLEKNNVSVQQIDELQSPEMMNPGQGLCGMVAETKAFQYAVNWRKALKSTTGILKPSSNQTYKLEERFIKGKDLYEWPIIEGGQVKYIICITQHTGSVLPNKILLSLEQLIFREWQKISLILRETIMPIKIGQLYKSELARMKGIYNHSFQQRFFAPIQVLLNELGENDNRFKALKKRISMYQFAVQAINQDMQLYINNAPKNTLSLGKFINNDIQELFDWNMKYLMTTTQNPGYGKIKLKCKVESSRVKIEVNRDIFEQAILQIITNALEIDVFTMQRVFDKPENCKISISVRYEVLKQNSQAVISIQNNGEPMEDSILEKLSKMFEEMRSQGMSALNDFQYMPISNRKGSNSGTGMIYSAAVISSVTDGNRSGYITVNSKNGSTTFNIYLPIKIE